jgi:endonuclease YncB( thermonuclease family)
MKRKLGNESSSEMRLWIKSLIIVAFALSICTANAAEIVGVSHVVDGDTITIADVKIRLDGIDAPETDQVCLDRQAARWTCGIEARNELSQHIADRAVHCTPTGVDVYRRVLADCRLNDEDLNAWMVRQGWALAFVRYSKAYVLDEASARNAQRGMWAGAFIAPWDWRSRTRQTAVLGAVSVPVTAQALLLAPASASGAPSLECIIKGNVNRKGERIYHRPGGASYAQINMKAAGKRWFCTEDDAQAAGWRPAVR